MQSFNLLVNINMPLIGTLILNMILHIHVVEIKETLKNIHSFFKGKKLSLFFFHFFKDIEKNNKRERR